MTIRKISAAVAASSALVLMAGCSGSNSDSTGPDGATTITWLDGWTDGPAAEAVETMIEKFEAEHEDIQIERTVVPFGDISTTIIQNVSSGSGPDIVAFDGPDTQTLASQGVLAPLDDYMDGWEARDYYYEGAWDSAQYEDATYGVPLYSDAPGIYVNMDLLKEAGISEVPATWSEMADAAEAMTDGSTFGLCYGTTPYESASYLVLPFIWQTGGDIDDLTTSALPGLEYFRDLMDAGSVPPDAVAWSWDDSMNQFLNGACGMVFGGPWNSPMVGDADFEAAAGPVPTMDDGEPASVLGGFNIGSASGADTDAAWDVIDWFTSTEHLGELLTMKQQLPNRSDLEDLDFIDEDPFLPAFVESIAVAKPRSYGEDWPEMSQALQTMLQATISGSSTPEEAATDASAVIEPLLQE